MQTRVGRDAGPFIDFAILTGKSWLTLARVIAVFQILTRAAVQAGLFHRAYPDVFLAICPTEPLLAVAKVGVTFFITRSIV